MAIQNLPPIVASIFSLLAIASLLLTFVMLGSHWLIRYLYAFAAESWFIAALSATVGFYGNYPELYLIAILTLFFRGLLLPYLSGASSGDRMSTAKSMSFCNRQAHW